MNPTPTWSCCRSWPRYVRNGVGKSKSWHLLGGGMAVERVRERRWRGSRKGGGEGRGKAVERVRERRWRGSRKGSGKGQGKTVEKVEER